jgi:hypothetical protein
VQRHRLYRQYELTYGRGELAKLTEVVSSLEASLGGPGLSAALLTVTLK